MALGRIQYPSPGFSQHWKQPAGKSMLRRIPNLPAIHDITDFNQLYLQCDTLADQVVQDLFGRMSHREGHELLLTVLDKGLDAIPNIPDSLRQLYQESIVPPAWLKEDLIQQGIAFCQRTGVYSLITLRNYSLMGGYESAAINKPLIYTGALKAGPAKRLSETVAFWVDVTATEGLKPSAKGFKSALHVRIVHAMARHYTRNSTDWNDAQWGIPVNEGDMVATYLGFSLVFLEGLQMLGFRPTKKEQKGVFHLWKYIGHLLGIKAEHLPDNEQQAIEILYVWTMTQPPADADTLLLAKALKDAPLTGTFPEKLWQKKLLVKIYLGFNFYFLGKHACKRMQLPSTVFRFLPYIFAGINRLKECRLHSSAAQYQKAVNKGRIEQEKIVEAFLKSTGYIDHLRKA